MDTLTLDGQVFELARATEADVPAIVGLLTDDAIGAGRESADLAPYVEAFHEIDRDDAHLLLAARDEAGTVVATMQLTIIPGLSRGGTKRLLIEGVRVASSTRGSGLGTALFARAHAWGVERGATLAQLTSDKRRADAHHFYETLGYEASHEGFKLPL
ncbi:GNAT family N-acetyltransferase [Aeromicrobium choanae]|uniref:Predicted N-acetyltransferase YhbS n=1 Tax=Aeromicrobium choanae TaxID=1736691 RepID=A0A1T4YQK2_9ACTN|nr:GNAT family N-acetyltransferase [Aeromicrobium choanae]SKB03858.1 Predicted N-acetyltransferase YhbS [Aeromicrobium choanae]